MKQLYYNPIELPEKIRIKSSCFNINVEYSPQESDGKPVFFAGIVLFVQIGKF